MKHTKQTRSRRKKSTIPNNGNNNSSVTTKQLSGTSSESESQNVEEKTSKVAFDVNEDGEVVSAEENRNPDCIIDTDDHLPATQPIDDRVLKDVVVYVEVRSTNDNRSKAICRELVQLGAVVAKTFTDDVTHVVLKEGSKRTINKATKKGVHLVSVLWVDSCKQNQQHVSERLYPAMLPDQKGTPLFIAKLKKAKSMQPRDFADDLASSAERFAKKKKKQKTERFKSTESTPCNSPRLGVILVEDTQPRGSPLPTRTSDIHTPIRLTIPDTPPSMRAKMMELNRQLKDNNDDESTEEIQYDKPEFDEPLQRRLFTGVKGCDSKNPEASDDEKTVSFSVASPPVITPKREVKRRVSSRRKSVASVCFKDNVENFQKEVARNSLPEATKMEEKRTKKSTQRRKSMAAVRFTNVDQPADEGAVMRRVNTKRRSVQPKTTNSDVEVEEVARRSRKSLEKIEMFLESDRTADSDSSKPEDTEISGVQGSSNKGSGNVHSRTSEEVNCSDNTVDEKNQKSFTKTNNRRRSSKIAAKNIEKLLDDDKTGVCTSMDSSLTKIQTVAGETNVKILKPKKRLLATSDMEAHSFLIAPTMCSQKVFGKILENTPDRTSTHIRKSAKVQGQKRKKHSFNDSTDSPKRCKKESKTETSSISADSRVSTGENKSSSQQANTDHDSRNVSGIESMLDSSMSVVFSESTCTNPFGIAPPRQSIDEFNLRTKFNNKKMKKKKKKKALSDSAVSSQNTESDTSSSSEEVRVKRMRRHPSFTKSSPIRPSLVMTSLHSHEQDVVISVVKKLKGFTITDHVNDSTTHVVCGGPRRTLNILHAITRGCWILRKEWVMESLEACQWLPEEGYEVTDWFPSAQVTRFRRQTSQENAPQLLFDSVGLFFITPKAVPPRHHLMELIQRCAGKVTSSSSKADIYVGSDFLPEKTSVNPLWILDCVTQNCLLPMDSYLLGRPKRESSPEF